MEIIKDVIVRDATGAPINIGAWEEQWMEQPLLDEQGRHLVDENGNPAFVPVLLNPLPEGAYEEEADIVVVDGARYLATDPRVTGA